MSAFMKSVDTKLLGRKTYELSLRLRAKFESRTIVFSRQAPPAGAPSPPTPPGAGPRSRAASACLGSFRAGAWGSSRSDRRGIEDHEIGDLSGRDLASPVEVELPRGESRHSMHGLFQREQAEVARVVPEHARERAP